MKEDILIIFGGPSLEAEVSTITALQTFRNIDTSRYTPHLINMNDKNRLEYWTFDSTRNIIKSITPIELSRTNHSITLNLIGIFSFLRKKINPAAAILCFHGSPGESGAVQGVCDLLGLPYTSSPILASAIIQDKEMCKRILRDAKIPTLPCITVSRDEIKKDITSAISFIEKSQPYPLIAKGNNLGSSIGVRACFQKDDLIAALLEISELDTEILCEEYLEHVTEYNIAVTRKNGDIIVSEIEQPLTDDTILSFEDKYVKGANKLVASNTKPNKILPAQIPESLRKQIESTAIKAYSTVKAAGIVRIDFMLTKDSSLYITEINNIPGSLSSFLWEAKGIAFSEILHNEISEAIKRLQTSAKSHHASERSLLNQYLETCKTS